MDLRGQRFTVDLDDDHDDETSSNSTIPSSTIPSLASAFVGDIKERPAAAPTAPRLQTTPTGFPEHRKRTRVSAFKQQRGAAGKTTVPNSSTVAASPAAPSPPPPTSRRPRDDQVVDDEERRRIDEENNQRLASMSAEDIDEERQELLAGLNPSLIERLLRRADLDHGRGDTGIEPPGGSEPEAENGIPTTTQEDAGAVPAPIPAGKPVIPAKSVRFEDDGPAEPADTSPTSSSPPPLEVTQPAMHFPTAPAAPELDPSDPSFLENLHAKYFPSLPADPSKLAWMAPVPTHGSVADQESPYYPNHETLAASALRFDFRGGLLPPRIARAIPTSKGLHHHGEAPEAAGYTVPELARLARSAFPAQRCVAFQTLGRLLYRLGRGEWGDEDSEIAKGLWRCVEEGKVVETLEEAAAAETGHQGSKVYAVEAVWLWQKGGGKRWKAS
jgi:hypothetical protein